MKDRPIAYDAYQELADSYAQQVDTKPHNAFYDRPAMLSLLPDVNGMHVLDAGCGPGAYSQELVRRGATVEAVDMSEKMLEQAAARLKFEIDQGLVKLQQLDLSQPLSMFADGSFDLINAALCLDYIANWTSVFIEFHRILKAEGTLVFSCGHPAFDAEYFKTRNYFSVEPVDCVWRGFGKKIRMPSYRRSLQEVINPVATSGLVLEQLLEPQPTDDFKRADPVHYRRLMHRPGFLCVKARKPVK